MLAISLLTLLVLFLVLLFIKGIHHYSFYFLLFLHVAFLMHNKTASTRSFLKIALVNKMRGALWSKRRLWYLTHKRYIEKTRLLHGSAKRLTICSYTAWISRGLKLKKILYKIVQSLNFNKICKIIMKDCRKIMKKKFINKPSLGPHGN